MLPGPADYPIQLWRDEILTAFDVVNFLHRAIAGVTVAFLNLARELLNVAVDLVQVIVGELPPLSPGCAFPLMPLALQHVFIHRSSNSLTYQIVVHRPCLARPGSRDR